MKNWLVFLVSIFLVLSSSLFAQKANFELADKFTSDKMKKMIGSTSVRPNWIEKSDVFWYNYKTSDGTNYYIVDANKKSKKRMFDNDELASQLTMITHYPYNAKELPIKNIEFAKNKKVFTFEVDSLKFRYNINNTKLTFVDTLNQDSLKAVKRFKRWARYSPDSTWIVYAKNHNLFLLKADDLKQENPDTNALEIQLTEDGERWYSYARSAGDTSKDKRLSSRARWFENSKMLYIIKSDSREVEDLFLVHSLKKPRPTLQTYKYTMAGDENIPQQELIVFDVATKERLDIDIKKWKDQSVGRTYTIKSSNNLYFVRRDRTFSNFDVCVANTKTGEVKVLFSEVSKPSVTDNYSGLIILNEGKDLVWWSERDGWGHLYHYDSSGNLIKQLTRGPFVVGRVSSIDSARNILYFPAYGKEKDVNPYFNMYYRVDLSGRAPKLLTPEESSHSFYMSKSNKYFVDTYSRFDHAPKSVLRDKNGKVLMELEETDISRLVASGWKKPESFIVKAGDDVTDLYGVMWKPFNFDPEKKYPIITHVYPGPQTESVPTTFSISSRTTLAQLGFIVVSVGNRGGSPKRSKYYHSYGYGNNRDYPLEDNKYALEQLARLYPFIDISRVGIYGHSGGGNMSTAAMFKYPDFYKVAVSSAGNHDNNIYNIWWGESHYGVEEVIKKKGKNKKKNEEEKSASEDSVKKKKEISFKAKYDDNASIAKNLKGHLLLIHGEVDNNVHPANTYRVVNALIRANKRFDFMMLPGKKHSYGNYNKYIERLRWYYFAEHLLGDYRDGVDLNIFDKN